MQTHTLTPQEIHDIVKHSHLHGKEAQFFAQFFLKEFSVLKVKENSVRQIYRLIPKYGKNIFYFKYFHHLSWYKQLFHFTPRIEYMTAEWVNSLGIPILPYSGWGRTLTGGFVFSREIDVLQARHYIFQSACHSEILQMDFFRKLAVFCNSMLQKKILHPDFHLGNILVRCDNSSILLADPPGIRRVHHVNNKLSMALLVPWREMFGIFANDTLVDFVIQAGLFPTRDTALTALNSATEQYREMRLSHYAKIRNQVLSGNSKYTRDFEINGKLYSFHHDLAFNFPTAPIIDQNWTRKDFKGIATSERLWINSMLYQDCNELQPILRVLYKDGNSSLYYTDFKRYNI